MRKLTLEEVITKFKKKHGGKYDYSNVKYKNSRTKIEIICKEHGPFWQSPTDHMHQKHGCPTCACNKPLSMTDFIVRAQRLHKNKYDYSKVLYKNTMEKVEIVCKKHGSFWQVPFDHFIGSGCPGCSPSGFNPTLSAILYYIQDITNGYYKIGITNGTIETRFPGKLKDIKIIKIWFYSEGFKAKEQEKKYHLLFKNQRVINENFRNIGGFTEFFESDVLILDT